MEKEINLKISLLNASDGILFIRYLNPAWKAARNSGLDSTRIPRYVDPSLSAMLLDYGRTISSIADNGLFRFNVSQSDIDFFQSALDGAKNENDKSFAYCVRFNNSIKLKGAIRIG